MELVVHKSDLLRELQLFQGIVERKNTIPILANVLLEAKGEEVKFLATDLEVALRTYTLNGLRQSPLAEREHDQEFGQADHGESEVALGRSFQQHRWIDYGGGHSSAVKQ